MAAVAAAAAAAAVAEKSGAALVPASDSSVIGLLTCRLSLAYA